MVKGIGILVIVGMTILVGVVLVALIRGMEAMHAPRFGPREKWGPIPEQRIPLEDDPTRWPPRVTP